MGRGKYTKTTFETLLSQLMMTELKKIIKIELIEAKNNNVWRVLSLNYVVLSAASILNRNGS